MPVRRKPLYTTGPVVQGAVYKDGDTFFGP